MVIVVNNLNNMSTRIEFIKGESNCRFDGIIMTEENNKELYGYEGEIDILDDDSIIIDNTIYSNKKFGEIVKLLGDIHGEVEEYDMCVSQGNGLIGYHKDKELENKVVINLFQLDYLDNLKPFDDFQKDYPDFNLEKYKEIYSEIDEYYNQLRVNAGMNSTKPHSEVKKALEGTLFLVSVYEDDELIGLGRIVGDGGVTFVVSDIMVDKLCIFTFFSNLLKICIN